MSDPRIFLGMPGYGDLTAGAARGFWRSTSLPANRVHYQYSSSSLLALNFNGLWCSALNHAHAGRRIDYFAMQHSDIEPEDYWLDTLIEEMDARDLDVLGVAVPIKDSKGVTSLALARPDGDTWRPLCRLTMPEVFRLPETFTSEDVGAPLLLNTGLWVCRFDPSWAAQVRFTINDRIIRCPDGSFRAQVEPEDWYFSRLCHELGLKVGATRKVQLQHSGRWSWNNTSAWGQPFDREYVEASPLPESLPPAMVWPADVPGWLRRDEGEELFRLARGRRVFEIGSYCGLSTVCLAQSAESVVAVDPHDGRGTPAPKDTLLQFRASLERYGVTDKVRVRVGTMTPEDVGMSDRGAYDLVFIDGAHDAASLANDIACARELLTSDGLIVVHDYGNPDEPDVTAAVDALISGGGELVEITNTLAVVRPPCLSLVPLEV